MPITTTTFFIGMFALCGLFPTSGFFSKEAILAAAGEHSAVLFGVALFSVFLTAFYMGRLATLAFMGPEKTQRTVEEAPIVMTLPLCLLALLSLFGGYFHIPELLGAPVESAHHGSLALTLISTGIVILGLAGAFLLYRKHQGETDPLLRGLGPIYQVLSKKYWVDDLYNFYVLRIQQPFAQLLENANQLFVIKGLTNLTGEGLYRLGSVTRKSLTGNIQTYLLMLGFQILIIVAMAILLVVGMK